MRRQRKAPGAIAVLFAVAALGFWTGDVGAQWMQRVVGDEAAPDEAPEGVEGFAGVAAACGFVELREEAGAGALQGCEELVFACPLMVPGLGRGTARSGSLSAR